MRTQSDFWPPKMAPGETLLWEGQAEPRQLLRRTIYGPAVCALLAVYWSMAVIAAENANDVCASLGSKCFMFYNLRWPFLILFLGGTLLPFVEYFFLTCGITVQRYALTDKFAYKYKSGLFSRVRRVSHRKTLVDVMGSLQVGSFWHPEISFHGLSDYDKACALEALNQLQRDRP